MFLQPYPDKTQLMSNSGQ